MQQKQCTFKLKTSFLSVILNIGISHRDVSYVVPKDSEPYT